ncbi:MAG: hypothetical protein ACI86M_000302 [Saprospiraceae bacterium]|jgi:hypothetical protein
MNLDIYQITLLLSKQQVITLGLFNDGKSNEDSKYMVFYQLIHSTSVVNDDEAIKILNYKNRASFLKFKDRYKNKLLDYILLSQARIPKTDTSNEEYYNLLKLFSTARILHLRNQTENAIILYNHIHQRSLKLEYLDLLIFTTDKLKQHYAFIEPNKKLFIYYTERTNINEANYIKMNKINHYYDKISHDNIILSSSNLPQFKEETLITSQKLLAEIEETDLFEYKYKVLEIASYACNINEEFEKSIQYSKKSILLTKAHFKKIHTKIAVAYKDILNAYLRLNDFNNAQLYLSKILEVSKSINHNYFRYKSLEFTLYTSTLDYNNLYTLTKEILSQKKIKDYKIHIEEWTIREAFVNILVEAGKVDPKLIANSKRKFKLSKFINEVEFYSKDKRGTNISVQVIQLIHFLIRKDYDKIVDRLDALNQYTFRYLKNDETLRSNCFIKMLLKLPEAEYHPLRTKRYVAKYEKKLAENSFEISMKEIAIEIIPYEHLWDIIMEILNKNLERKTSKR